MPERPTYRAFLSYSHKDKEQAIAWQQRLEAFDVHWAFDDLPAPSFKRVFRDETDLPLGAALTPEIYAALDGSDSLILIGSPNARDSGYVNAEIAYFRTHHPERPIVCILCGPPDTAFRDHLPKTLAYALDPDGNPTDTEETPISANPQEGEQVCAARVIGCSLNLPPDKLAAWVREIAARQTAAEKAQQERDAREEQRHKELLAEMAKMQALVTGSGVIGRAAVQGIPEPAVRAIVERLGGQDIGLDDLIPWLDNWIEHARVALRQHGNEGAAYEAAYREAERRFAAGRLTEAHDAFMEELHREQARDAERQAESRHRQVTLLEGSIEFAIRAVDIDAIVPKLRAIAAIEGLAAGDPLGERLVGWAAARYETGRDKGDNVSLLAAIVAYRAALLEYTRGRVPLDWARTQNNLGNALSTLGERESGTARLEEAVAAYRAALLEYTRERVPLNWATTQNNLGAALQRLGARESGTARLEEAVAAYRAALLEWTRERVPLDWARTQNNLGNALSTLGERESGTARLEEAVAAYRAALLELTRERVPLDWATTQNNLGNALSTLGERESGTARLDEAVVAYRAALLEWTRERVPLDWAMTQNNLGIVLQTLGARESGTVRLEEAVAAYRAALLEFARERVPLNWAMTQNNLGNALSDLGERESGTARLEEAVTAYRAALLERTRERVPLNWATTQNNLGAALQTIGERESGTARLEEAVAAYRAALEERTRERVPLDWAYSQHGLGNALATLAERTGDRGRMTAAIGCMRDAADVYREGGVSYWLPIAEERVKAMEAALAKMP